MFFLMISCFLLCWTPYAVVSMMEAFGRKSMVSPTVAIIPSFFAKSSTAYNPLIYVFMSRKVCCSKVLSVVDFENITRITLMPGHGETLARLNTQVGDEGDAPQNKQTWGWSWWMQTINRIKWREIGISEHTEAVSARTRISNGTNAQMDRQFRGRRNKLQFQGFPE